MEDKNLDLFRPSGELAETLSAPYPWEKRVSELVTERASQYGRPDYDINHIKAVVNWAKILGHLEGLSPKETEILIAAAWFHDIGYDFSKARDLSAGRDAVHAQKETHPIESARLASEWYQKEEALRLAFDEKGWSEVLSLIREHDNYDKVENEGGQSRLLPYLFAADTLGQIDIRGGVELSYKGEDLKKYIAKSLSRRLRLIPSSKARVAVANLINVLMRGLKQDEK